jgi:hypothetical protein
MEHRQTGNGEDLDEQIVALPAWDGPGEHIASWHPTVALAAAAMLEAAAAEMDDYGPDSAIHDVPVWTTARELARAFLGEVSGE